MASCSLRISDIKVSALGFNKTRVNNVLNLNDQRAWVRQKPLKYPALAASQQPLTAVQVSSVPPVETADAKALKENSEEIKSPIPRIPNPSEVETLITEICDSTSIAEFELKLGGFRLYVARNLADKTVPPPPSTPAPVAADTNGSASSTSLAIVNQDSSLSGSEKLANRASREGLVLLQSPKVGFFRRSRNIKGKRMPPACKEKQIVKEGQVLCYIEQLGAQIPIESDASGEVVEILREDGDPVGYNDALITVLPSSPA